MKTLLAFFVRLLVPNLRLSARRWRTEPRKQLVRVLLSILLGQGVFWTFGYDQLSFLLNKGIELGAGRKVAAAIYPKLPKWAALPWILKIIEIIFDAIKMPLEGELLRRWGIVPDGVAAVIPQPTWSLIEVFEKLAGALIHPERVMLPESVRRSIGCIYGTIVRLCVGLGILLVGRHIDARRQKEA